MHTRKNNDKKGVPSNGLEPSRRNRHRPSTCCVYHSATRAFRNGLRRYSILNRANCQSLFGTSFRKKRNSEGKLPGHLSVTDCARHAQMTRKLALTERGQCWRGLTS